MSRSEWKPATPSRRCKVCKSPKRCAISDDGAVAKCTYVFDGPNVFKGGDDEVGQWAMHRLDGSAPADAARYQRHTRDAEPDPALADVPTRDRVYTALLAACPLSAEHREGLLARGLTAEEIAARGYGSLPLGAGPRTRIVAQVRGILGAETIPEGIPGMHDGKLPEGLAGTLVPVRDVTGSIVAMKVRRDGAADPKYLWLSSKKAGGATPHSPAHVALGSREAVDAARINSATGARPEVVVRITEGELKADVAFPLSGVPTICIPGAGAWRSAVEPVRALAPDVLRLAWDADARTNEHVAAALETAAIRYTQELPGVAIELETWEPATGKGIDDVLLAGAPTTLHRGEALWHEIIAILNAAGVDPRAETVAHAGVVAVPSVDHAPRTSAPPDDAWTATLARGRRAEVLSSYGNVAKIVRNAPPFAGRLRLNTMTQEVEWNGSALLESRIGEIREAIEDGPARWGGFAPNKGDVVDAVRADAETRSYHPVQEFFANLPPWDRTPRIEGVATDVMGAPSDPLILAMIRRWFVSAVARAMEPGCKVDTALVLLGEQGHKKSSFFAALAPKWFGDTEIKIGDKDGLQQIHHNWITEWAEIDRITSVRHAGEVKTFIARRRDCFRPPYGMNARNYDRSCVIVGSTNNDEFLSDPTGGRRFWVIPVTREIDMAYIERVRDQLWAEALHLYRAGEQWWLTKAEEGMHKHDVEQYRIRDPWEEIVARWIENAWPTESFKLGRSSFTTWDVMSLALKLDPKDARKETEGRVGAVMRALGYERDRPSRSDVAEYLGKDGKPTKRPRVWVRRVEQDAATGAGSSPGAEAQGPGEADGAGSGADGGGFVEGSASARASSPVYAPPVRAYPPTTHAPPMGFDDDDPPCDLPFSTGPDGHHTGVLQ